MKNIIVMMMCLMALFSCSKDESYNDEYKNVQTVEDTFQSKETTINGLYYLDDSCRTDTIAAFVSDGYFIIGRYCGNGFYGDICELSYAVQDDKIVFGNELADVLESLYISEIEYCREWIRICGDKNGAYWLEFFTNRLNNVGKERKAFMTIDDGNITLWDIKLVGDLSYNDDGMKVIIHSNNGISKIYEFIRR